MKLIAEFLIPFVTEIDRGRLTESLIFLGVLLWRLLPHLRVMEKRMLGVEEGVQGIDKSQKEMALEFRSRFESGEARFISIEELQKHTISRLDGIEIIVKPRTN